MGAGGGGGGGKGVVVTQKAISGIADTVESIPNHLIFNWVPGQCMKRNWFRGGH